MQPTGRQFWLWDVMYPFAVSRAIIFAILLVAPLTTVTSDPGGIATIQWVGQENVRARIEQALLPGDALHYLDIAQRGYADPVSRAWFPLFSVFWRMAASVTGEYPITGCVLSNGFFVGALFLLYKLVLALGFSRSVASRSLLLLTIYPTSHFFSVPLSEGLFLLLTVGSFYSALRQRWWICGVLGGLASTTRFAGLLLLPPLMVLFYLESWPKPGARWHVLALALIPAGLVAFCTYMYFVTGDFFAYQHSPQHTQFTHLGLSWDSLVQYAAHPRLFDSWTCLPLQMAVTLAGFYALWVFFRRRQWVLAIYLAGSLLLPLSAGVYGSMTRYLMVSFPFVLFLAERAESPKLDYLIRTLSVASLALLTLACALKFGLGMT